MDSFYVLAFDLIREVRDPIQKSAIFSNNVINGASTLTAIKCFHLNLLNYGQTANSITTTNLA